jgi:hypothetical protein
MGERTREEIKILALAILIEAIVFIPIGYVIGRWVL